MLKTNFIYFLNNEKLFYSTNFNILLNVINFRQVCLLLNASDVYRSLALLLSSSVNLTEESANDTNKKKKLSIPSNTSNSFINDEDINIDFVVYFNIYFSLIRKLFYLRVKWL